MVAFVRDNELHVIDLSDKKDVQLTEGATDGLTHGLAEFMAQEEMGRSTGFWWSPDGAMIAYQETDERHIPFFTISHQGGSNYSVETHRYPFPGAANAKIRLGLTILGRMSQPSGSNFPTSSMMPTWRGWIGTVPRNCWCRSCHATSDH